MIDAIERWGGADHFGWEYANNLFRPSGSFLHDQDTTMDWLYKARAIIGAALLVAIGIHYHQAAKSVTANFNPVLGGIGGITGPLILGLLFVVPATVAVVAYTVQGERREAFLQMMRYPAKTALICLGVYGALLVLDQVLKPLVAKGSFLIDILVVIGGGLLYLRYFLFLFRGIYLVTVGICRLGDGHPLLPPIVGSAIAWWAGIHGFVTSSAGAGEPSRIWLGALFGGPASITLLGIFEIYRLRKWHQDSFPFRSGPLPPPNEHQEQQQHQQQRSGGPGPG